MVTININNCFSLYLAKGKIKMKKKNNKGITLISLIITIVVLIILAGVTIFLNLNNNGLFSRAKQASEETNKQTATEKINLKITTAQMNKYADDQTMPTLKELSEVLRDDTEIQYVTEKSQIASTKYEVGENPSSIFTKLNEFPYEFEINGQLQLASIDGIKIANNNQVDSEKYVGFPDYTNREVLNSSQEYTAEQNMYIIIDSSTANKTHSALTITIDGVTYNFYQQYTNVDYPHPTNSIFPIKKGSKFSVYCQTYCTIYKVNMIY